MIRDDLSIKVSLIQERINNAFSYKVSYKKAWMTKKKCSRCGREGHNRRGCPMQSHCGSC